MCFWSIFWVSTSWTFENSIEFSLPSNKKSASYECRRILVICSTATRTLGRKLLCVSIFLMLVSSSYSLTENSIHKWEEGLIRYLTGTKCHWFSKDDWGIWWEGKLDKSRLVCLLACYYNYIILIISTPFFPYLTFSFLLSIGKFLSMLPVDPKLGKMLIMGAIFHCFDPILTIVSGLSVRDPFLLPQDKKDVSIILLKYAW